MVEHGGIPCIWFLIAGDIHVDATEFEWPCDVVLEEPSNAGFGVFYGAPCFY